MTTVKICFRISEQTIRLERRRSPATMSGNDLEWVFGGEIDFVDAESQQPLLSLEAPLLGFAEDLSELGLLRADGSYEIPDRYGSYRLIVTATENHVDVGDVAIGAFQAERNQFTWAMGDFGECLRASLVELFPELNANPEFNRLSQEISDRFLAGRRR